MKTIIRFLIAAILIQAGICIAQDSSNDNGRVIISGKDSPADVLTQNEAIALADKITSMRNKDSLPAGQTVPESAVIISSSGKVPQEEDIKGKVNGKLRIYGSGTFSFTAKGNMKTSASTFTSITRETGDLEKEKVIDGLEYRNLDSDIKVFGKKVEMEFEGDAANIDGRGCGVMLMDGEGEYQYRDKSGSIPEQGIGIDFGIYQESYSVYLVDVTPTPVPQPTLSPDKELNPNEYSDREYITLKKQPGDNLNDQKRSPQEVLKKKQNQNPSIPKK